MQEASGPTLTNITYGGRLFVKYGILVLIFLIVGRFTLNAAVAYYRALNPPKPPAPTQGFGPLPALIFPEEEAARPTSYILETAQGTLPSYGDRAKVFWIPASTPSLLADQEAKKRAADMGFVFEPQVIETELYRWEKTVGYISTLEMNTTTKQFSIQSDFLSHPELIGTTELPDPFQAATQMKTSLSSMGITGSDIATASAQITYLRSTAGQLVPAVSASDAEFIQIDINRNPIDNLYPMYTSKGYQGVISFILGAENRRPFENLVSMEQNYHLVDYLEIHTYPLLSAESALATLQSGKGFVVQSGTKPTATIRKVSLGYYDSFEPQLFLQPIYVFEGDEGFLAYVPAIEPNIVKSGL